MLVHDPYAPTFLHALGIGAIVLVVLFAGLRIWGELYPCPQQSATIEEYTP